MASILKIPKVCIAGLKIGSLTGPVNGIASMRTKITVKPNFEVFSFKLSDEDAEIGISVFGKKLAETWEICDEEQNVQITGGVVKLANKQYNKSSNNLEMTISIDGKGAIVRVDAQINPPSLNFIEIASLASFDLNRFVNIVGAVTAIELPEEIRSRKTGSNVIRAKATIVDETGCSVTCTFWNESTEQVDSWNVGDILQIQSAKLQQYNGSLELGCNSAKVVRNPTGSKFEALHGWYKEASLSNTQFQSLVKSVDRQSDADVFAIDLPSEMLAILLKLKGIKVRCGGRELFAKFQSNGDSELIFEHLPVAQSSMNDS